MNSRGTFLLKEALCAITLLELMNYCLQNKVNTTTTTTTAITSTIATTADDATAITTTTTTTSTTATTATTITINNNRGGACTGFWWGNLREMTTGENQVQMGG